MNIQYMVVEELGRAGAFLALYIVIFLLAKWAKDFLTPYKLNEELVKKDNFAIALAISGYYIASAAIFVGALLGPSKGLFNDLISVGGYSALGLVFLNIARWLNDKMILNKFCDTDHLVKKHNLGVGAVHFGVYVATGFIAAGAISGQGGGVVSAVVFFILGQLSLFLFGCIYGFFTPYNIHAEIEKQNIAAGVAFSGTLIALSIIIMKAVSGDFVNWKQDITLFAAVNVMAFVFLPIIRLLMDRVVIPGHHLSKEIRDDQNLGAGILEAVLAIGFSVILVQLI